MHPGPWWIVSLVSARENPSNVAAFGGDRPLAQKTGSAQTCGRESSVARTFLYCRRLLPEAAPRKALKTA